MDMKDVGAVEFANGRRLITVGGEPVPVEVGVRSSVSAPSRLKVAFFGRLGEDSLVVLGPEFRLEMS